MEQKIKYILADSPVHYEHARRLFREYADHIEVDLCFQGFEKELTELEKQYGPPEGGILLVRSGEEFVGCAGIRKISERTAELKRMYLQPSLQGKGLGRELLSRSMQLAKQLGYTSVRLDTLQRMKAALKLYRETGFEEIEPYYHNPNGEVVYMEKAL